TVQGRVTTSLLWTT
nr:immunoglobulin heavy chain junction region [Mus musculus]